VNDWPLLGVGLVIVGFALRLNAVLVVVAAGVATGLAAGLEPLAILELLGSSIVRHRYLLILVLLLPVVGLLERHGLREHAQDWIRRMRGVTTARLLIAYLSVRQLAAMVGLTSLGGHPQTVRPLLVPMAEATAAQQLGELDARARERLRAMCAGTDNVGLFFGEDVFFAFGAVLLIQAFLADHGIVADPWTIARWGLPTAVAAWLIHSVRLKLFERALARAARPAAQSPVDAAAVERSSS
jgi:uncharacterized membrane protein